MPNPTPSDDVPSRRKTVRDVLIFQVKLWLEGFKDVVLMPLSLGAAVIDLVFRRGKSRGTLYSVMRLGDRFERWVHLYAALDEAETQTAREDSLDDLLHEAADGFEERAMNGGKDATDRSQTSS